MIDSFESSDGAAGSADTALPGTAREAVLGSWALFAAVLLVMLGNGMMLPLLGIRAELEGFSTAATGIMMGSYYTGFLAGAMLTRRMVFHVGHIRVYAALASLASTATLVYIVAADPIVWSGARLLTGFAMSGLFIIAESWLGDASTNQNRGRILAAYMVVLMGGHGPRPAAPDPGRPGRDRPVHCRFDPRVGRGDPDHAVRIHRPPPGRLRRQAAHPAGLGKKLRWGRRRRCARASAWPPC